MAVSTLTSINDRLARQDGDGSLLYTIDDMMRRTGLVRETIVEMAHALGRPALAPSGPVFTDADAELFDAAAQIAARRSDPAAAGLVRTIRTAAPALRRIADAHVVATIERDGSVPSELVDELDESGPAFEALLNAMWRHQLRRSVSNALSSVADPRQPELAVGFVDLAGYSARSQQLPSDELIELIDRFDAAALGACSAGGATLIKTIGDEVMFVHHDGSAATDVATDLVERCASDPVLLAARAGLAWGTPVAFAGDYYGPSVNLAARLVQVARTSAVVVDAALAEVLSAVDRYRVRGLEPRTLRGCGRQRPYAVTRAPG